MNALPGSHVQRGEMATDARPRLQNQEMYEPRLRPAVRALMIDPSDRVLLIRHSFPDWTGWLLPGGGVENHEDQHTALLRELAEEVGPPEVFLGPPVWHRRRLSPNRRDGYDGQEETVFLVPCYEFEIAPSMTPAELEADGIVEHRWWSADELAETEESIHPFTIHELVVQVLEFGAPEVVPLIDETDRRH